MPELWAGGITVEDDDEFLAPVHAVVVLELWAGGIMVEDVDEFLAPPVDVGSWCSQRSTGFLDSVVVLSSRPQKLRGLLEVVLAGGATGVAVGAGMGST